MYLFKAVEKTEKPGTNASINISCGLALDWSGKAVLESMMFGR